MKSTSIRPIHCSEDIQIYAPAFFGWRVGGKVMLGAGRPFANASDVLPDFSGQIVDMVRIPRIISKQPPVPCKAEGKSEH
jgi:hypothetical protein